VSVGVTQTIFGIVLVVMLLFLGGYYSWRQVRNLRALKLLQLTSPADRQHAYRQARRRLVSSALMLVFAGMLIGSFFLEGEMHRQSEHAKAANARGEEPVFTDEERDFQRAYTIYWIVSLLIFFAIVVLAAVDVFAIRRIGNRLRQQLRDERRAMIAEQLAVIRGQQNKPEAW
jgi:uncharacterized membrane protein